MGSETTEQAGHTPGPWEAATGTFGKGRVPKWEARKNHFPNPPYEGELDDEWGVYPPLGEAGPVALVAGEANARLIAASPALHAELESLVLVVESVLHERRRAIEAKCEARQRQADADNARHRDSEPWVFMAEYRRGLEAELEPMATAAQRANAALDLAEGIVRGAKATGK